MKKTITQQIWETQEQQVVITNDNKKLPGESFDAYMKRMAEQRKAKQAAGQ